MIKLMITGFPRGLWPANDNYNTNDNVNDNDSDEDNDGEASAKPLGSQG